MDWWLSVLPLEGNAAKEEQIAYHGATRQVRTSGRGPHPASGDRVMLVRNRKSRIYFLSRFFDYPITLSKDTLAKLGLRRTVRIGFSYLASALSPHRKAETLEQFFIQRFGKELYLTFFKEYTEKVWGIPGSQISVEWGAQRIKGLSITTTILHHIRKFFQRESGISQNSWTVTGVTATDAESSEARQFQGDYFFSTLPVKELVRSMERETPSHILQLSDGLVYRDFITVGLLLRKRKIADGESGEKPIADNWIYIQEPNVLAGRLQIFNNWSPYMVADPDTVWIGVEYLEALRR